MFSRVFPMFILCFISACSSLYDPVDFAKKGKWFEIGSYDGEKGMASRSLTELERLASGNSIDFTSYDRGYKQGIESYCQVDNAYSIGLAGMQYHGVCAHLPDSLRFDLEWQRGYQAYQNSL